MLGRSLTEMYTTLYRFPVGRITASESVLAQQPDVAWFGFRYALGSLNRSVEVEVFKAFFLFSGIETFQQFL